MEDENAKLKKLLAETVLDNAVLKDINAKKVITPAARRKAVAYVRDAHRLSKRRARTISLRLIVPLCATGHAVRTMRRPGRGCENWRMNTAGSAAAGWVFSWLARGSR